MTTPGPVFVLVTLGAALLSACTSLTAPPPPAPLNGASFCLTVAGPIDPANPSGGYRFAIRNRDYADEEAALADDLDCQLSEILARQTLYNDRYSAVAGEQRAINVGSLGSALIGAGFAVFDAHDDNVNAAALSLGGLTVLRNGLNQTELLDVYADGAAAMGCYAAPGQGVYRGLRLGHGEEIQGFVDELNRLISQARSRLENQPATNPDSEDDKAALRQAIAAATTAVTDLRASRVALNTFPTALARSWRSADNATLARLRQQTPNIASLVEAAQALATAPTENGGAGRTGDGAPPEALAAPTARSAASIRDDLAQVTGDARNLLNRTNYPAALAGLAQCQALASG